MEKKRQRRLVLSLAAGLVGAFLVNAVPERTEYTENIYREQAQITAWWGSLYPKFCFAEKPENTKEKVKISFWLAQVLDWCWNKSRETVIRYSHQICRFLQEQQVKAIVVACNTASAFALDAIRDDFDIPIIGVIEAGAKVAAARTRNKRVGIIGTVGTVGSGIHAEYLRKLDPEITVFGKACPLFVPLVEEGWLHDPVTTEVAVRYLRELQDKKVDTLILGCTHYPLLRSTIREIMGEDVCLVNPAYETALELGRLLTEKGLSSTGAQQKEFPYRFFVSDLADEFKEFANSILPYDVEMTKKIDIEKY